MFQVYNTLPFPIALRKDAIEMVELDVQYRRRVSAHISLESLRQAAGDASEMQKSFMYDMRFDATLYAVATLKEPITLLIPQEEEDDDSATNQIVIASQDVVLNTETSSLLTKQFLMEQRGLKESKVEKVQQYCERIHNYVLREQRALSALIEREAPETEGARPPELPIVDKAERLPESPEAIMESFKAKNDRIIHKINKIISQDVVIGDDEDEAQMTEDEMVLVETMVPDLAKGFLTELVEGLH